MIQTSGWNINVGSCEVLVKQLYIYNGQLTCHLPDLRMVYLIQLLSKLQKTTPNQSKQLKILRERKLFLRNLHDQSFPVSSRWWKLTKITDYSHMREALNLCFGGFFCETIW